MIKINMIGGGFQHDICSSAMNTNKYVEWVKDRSANISIHIDDALKSEVDPKKKNYGWFSESSAVIPKIIEHVKNNITIYKEKYEFIFTHDKRIVDTDPTFFKFTLPNALPWIKNQEIYTKNKNISFIVSSKNFTSGHKYRLDVLKKHEGKNIEHFGRGFRNELPWSIIFNNIEENGKILALKDFRFSFAFENDNYPSIFCEKITDCFATGTIPIYWGTPDIGDYFDTNGIIFYNDDLNIENLNEDLYYSKMDSVRNNFDLIKNLLSAEDYIYENYLK